MKTPSPIHVTRGACAWLAAGILIVSTGAQGGAAADQSKRPALQIVKKAFAYKTVDGQKLIADVFRADDKQIRPIFFRVHGGALIMGGRYFRKNWVEWFVQNGFVVVTFDYRMAPLVKMPEIYQDVKDAYAWTRANAKDLFVGDPDRIVVGGASAGGYLTFAAGVFLDPKPKVLLSLSGYGNIIAPWYTEPSDFYKKHQPIQTKEQVYALMRENPRNGRNRAYFYFYTRQTGLWPNILVGRDPKAEPEAFTPYCPVKLIAKDYPPVVFTHATRDYDVPYSESEAMARELKKHGVEHKFITIKGGRHAWSTIDEKVDPDGANRKAIMDFLSKHLNAATDPSQR